MTSLDDDDDDFPTGEPMPGKPQQAVAIRKTALLTDEPRTVATSPLAPPQVSPRADESEEDTQLPKEPKLSRRARRANKRDKSQSGLKPGSRTPQQDIQTVTQFIKSAIRKTGSGLAAASHRPGFYPTVLTALVLYVLVTVASFKWLHGIAMFVVLTIVIVHFVYAFKKLLKNANEPPNVAPPDAHIPNKGWPRVHYWVNKLYGRAHKVPRVNNKQELAWKNDHKRKRLREGARYVQPTVMVAGWKGNSAKTFTAYIGGSVMAMVLRGYSILLMLASINTKTGTAGSLAGLGDGKTITTRQLYSKLNEVHNDEGSRVLNSLAHTNEEGLRVIAEDPGGINKAVRSFIATMFVAMYLAIFPRTDIIWIDSGNDDVEEDTVVIEAMKRVVIPIFSAFVGAPQTLPKLRATMEDYRSLAVAEQESGKHFPSKGSRKTGEDIPLIEKVTHGIVLFSGLKKGETLEDYRKQYVPEWFKGVVLSVRWDEYLSTVKENLEIKMLDELTLGDFLELDITILEGAAWLLGITMPARHPAIASTHQYSLYTATESSDSSALNGALVNH